MADAPVLGIACHDQSKSGPLFPWQRRERVKKWALHRYRIWRGKVRHARRVAYLARLAMSGVMTLAQVVDWVTNKQLCYKLGALPFLYLLLETLQVRQITPHLRSVQVSTAIAQAERMSTTGRSPWCWC